MRNSNRKRGLSIFQRIFISYVGLGLLTFIIFGFIYYAREETIVKQELDSQFSNQLKEVTSYFDMAYSSLIKEDLNFIEHSSVMDNFIRAEKEDAVFARPPVEDLFLYFTNRSEGKCLSARFIDAQGQERIITSGNKRLRNYTSQDHFPNNVFYNRVYSLFKRLKSIQPGTILFEGPFKYKDKFTFLVGISDRDPDVGGFVGADIFHYDLTDYFRRLNEHVFFNEHVVRVSTSDGRVILAAPEQEGHYPNFYSASKTILIGNLPFLRIKFSASTHIFHAQMAEAFKYSIFWVLLSIVPIGFIAYAVSSYFSKPLISLAAYIDRLARGDLSVRADIQAPGEMGILVDSFNQMAEDLQRITVSEDQLREEINKRIIIEGSLRKAYKEIQEAHKELKEAQMQLLQSEKLASIGQLAAGVAHEINNPIGFISNNMEMLEQYTNDFTKILKMVEVLQDSLEENNMGKSKAILKEMIRFEQEINLDFIISDVGNLLRQTQGGIERVRKIVADLRTFAREDSDTMDLMKVEEVIDSVLSIVYNELKYKADLKKNYGDTPFVYGNPQRLGQVFINLLVNAVQAIDEKGIVEIKTYVKDKNVCIDIRDTGKGIKEENLNKIFDPFFTTKPVGKGTGLGLSVSHEIIKKHDGEIRVQSKEGEGATFTVSLPIPRGGM